MPTINTASAGYDDSLILVGTAYRNKVVTKNQYEKTLRSYQKAKKEMSSFERDMAKKYHDGGRDFSVFSESEIAELCGIDLTELNSHS